LHYASSISSYKAFVYQVFIEFSSMDRLLQVMAALRNPDGGCPWDLEQTFETIAPYTIEEAYEVEEAIQNKDYASLKEELGDLLLQVAYHSQIAQERNLFSFQDVVEAISQKMVDRHPHVFGNANERDADTQTAAWEKQKATERLKKAKAHGNDSVSRLDGVAVNLPALMRAEKLSKRAARAGFDWPDTNGVFDKIDEELLEIKEEIAKSSSDFLDRTEDEVGDLLFTVVNLARKLGVDPEVALRTGNRKFEKRFRHLEQTITEVEKATPEELQAAWVKAKTETAGS
jgi:nucleoside triphosphate diphosphatase